VVDVLDGSLVKGFSSAEISNMTYSIPSDITKLDLDGDGKIDRLYVGDMNGRMWRFDIGNANDTGSWTGKMIFKGNRGGSEKRKILYPPDVTLERQGGVDYEMLFFGTGDREDPKGAKSDKDILVVFKDKNASGTKDDSDLVNVTDFYSLSAIEQASKLNDIKTQYGWYIKLDKKDGEKCLSSPVVYNRTAYFTTFSPTDGDVTDLCFIGEGTAILYAMNYATGEAVFNLDLTNDVGGVFKIKSDRSLTIGTAIPSGVVMTVIGGKVTAYVGVGGGVYKPILPGPKSLFPMYWKLVF
jgi:type IV pilus assembly protein PilY1